MLKVNIAIATITLARDAREEQLLKKALQVLASFNIPVIVTDGGSNKTFVAFLRSFPHFTVLQKSGGVWAQAKNSVLAAQATGVPFIWYTEPDKHDFFQTVLSAGLEELTLHDKLGVLLFSRSASALATFPSFQQMTETTINNCCREIIGKPVDYTYGPFIMNSTLAPYLHQVQNDPGWGWRPFIFGLAHRTGLMVEAKTENFLCPDDQRDDNASERIYRMRQLYQNIEGLVLSTKVIIEPTLPAQG
jgi:hypothetical protein